MTKLITLFVSAVYSSQQLSSRYSIHPCLVDEVGTGTVRLVLINKLPGSGVSPEASYWTPREGEVWGPFSHFSEAAREPAGVWTFSGLLVSQFPLEGFYELSARP